MSSQNKEHVRVEIISSRVAEEGYDGLPSDATLVRRELDKWREDHHGEEAIASLHVDPGSDHVFRTVAIMPVKEEK